MGISVNRHYFSFGAGKSAPNAIFRMLADAEAFGYCCFAHDALRLRAAHDFECAQASIRVDDVIHPLRWVAQRCSELSSCCGDAGTGVAGMPRVRRERLGESDVVRAESLPDSPQCKGEAVTSGLLLG